MGAGEEASLRNLGAMVCLSRDLSVGPGVGPHLIFINFCDLKQYVVEKNWRREGDSNPRYELTYTG